MMTSPVTLTDVNNSTTRSSSESSLEEQRKEDQKARHREAQKRYRLARAERETTEQREKCLDRKRQQTAEKRA